MIVYTMATRHNNMWTINECLRLEREYCLLKLSIDEIAQKHQRTPNAIMHRLDYERFAEYNKLYEQYHNPQTVKGLEQFENESWYKEEDDGDNYMSTDEESTKEDRKKYIKNIEKQIADLQENLKRAWKKEHFAR